jgi:hypothetical protein
VREAALDLVRARRSSSGSCALAFKESAARETATKLQSTEMVKESDNSMISCLYTADTRAILL